MKLKKGLKEGLKEVKEFLSPHHHHHHRDHDSSTMGAGTGTADGDASPGRTSRGGARWRRCWTT
jgi:hypothetical protein